MGVLGENGFLQGGGEIARRFFVRHLGEAEIRAAVRFYVERSAGPGREMARSTLNQLHAECAHDECVRCYDAARTPETRINAVELLRSFPTERCLPFLERVLETGAPAERFWAADGVCALIFDHDLPLEVGAVWTGRLLTNADGAVRALGADAAESLALAGSVSPETARAWLARVEQPAERDKLGDRLRAVAAREAGPPRSEPRGRTRSELLGVDTFDRQRAASVRVSWADERGPMGNPDGASVHSVDGLLVRLVGEAELRRAVHVCLTHAAPGSVLANSVLRSLSPACAQDECVRLIDDAADPEQRADAVRLLGDLADASVLGVFERVFAEHAGPARLWAARGVLELVFREELEAAVAMAWTQRLIEDADDGIAGLGATMATQLWERPEVTHDERRTWLERIETLPDQGDLCAELRARRVGQP